MANAEQRAPSPPISETAPISGSLAASADGNMYRRAISPKRLPEHPREATRSGAGRCRLRGDIAQPATRPSSGGTSTGWWSAAQVAKVADIGAVRGAPNWARRATTARQQQPEPILGLVRAFRRLSVTLSRANSYCLCYSSENWQAQRTLECSATAARAGHVVNQKRQ
jgi:hypothetical protein